MSAEPADPDPIEMSREIREACPRLAAALCDVFAFVATRYPTASQDVACTAGALAMESILVEIIDQFFPTQGNA